MDLTERVAALIPEDKLDWRLTDPSGKWHFSLAEIVLHCADARTMFARTLSGNATEEGYWSAGPGPDGIWPFRPYSGKDEVLRSLTIARQELTPWLDHPAAALLDTTEGTRAAYEKSLSALREKGAATNDTEVRGPVTIIRVIMALAVHESGHRSTLQTLLRMHGINLAE